MEAILSEEDEKEYVDIESTSWRKRGQGENNRPLMANIGKSEKLTGCKNKGVTRISNHTYLGGKVKNISIQLTETED